EFECTQCGHAFELFQNMSEKPLRKCPKCRKLKVKRLIGSGAGIIFKGSGFYATDYRKKTPGPKPSGPASCPKAQEGCNGCQR
ncbi:MAG: FmdB family zinc ribbon protein, partial [Candidatus Omnitrophota bacterium]